MLLSASTNRFLPQMSRRISSRDDETMAIFGEQEKQLQRDALQFDELAVLAKLKGTLGRVRSIRSGWFRGA